MSAEHDTLLSDRKFEYDAFISYSRPDAEFVKALHDGLKSFKLPKGIKYNRSVKTFNYSDHDLSDGRLTDNIIKNIKSSNYLIIVCSRRPTDSDWVNREISEFLDHHDKQRIILVHLSPLDECTIPGAYAGKFFPHERIAFNFSGPGKARRSQPRSATLGEFEF